MSQHYEWPFIVSALVLSQFVREDTIWRHCFIVEFFLLGNEFVQSIFAMIYL